MSNTGQGNPRVYYNFAPQRLRTTTGALFISFKAWDPARGPAVIDRLRSELAHYPAAKFSVRRFENGPPIDAPIVVRVIGKELATLDALADRVVATIRSTQGTRDVDNRQSVRQIDLDFDVDQAKIGLLGVAPGAVDQSLSIVINGAKAADFYDTSGQSFPVVVRALSDNHFATADLSKLYVWNAKGAAIPLDQIVRVGFTTAPSQITRYQQERVIIIRAYAQPGFLPVDLARKIEGKLATIDLPSGYRFQLGGQAEAATASFSGLGVTLLVAVFGILIVLLWEFGSFSQAMVVAFVIPFGVSGGLIALWIAGYSLSFTAAIGFVALIGIEIKNSILLVDLANQLRSAGTELRVAVIRAGEERFLPVLLTSLTAIGGLIPLILEKSALYSPLAVVIAGGLVSSTLVARIVTPVVYLLLVGRSESETSGSEWVGKS
jgi:multidrug efflux pump subunit AcrB